MQDNTDLPLVTIGIPTYNRYDQLKQCIENALAQTYPNIEIIVSDNTVEYDTPGWIFHLVNEGKIKYKKQKINIGLINNENYVRENATGEYICIMHDDDIFPITYIFNMMDYMLKNKECVLSGPVCERFYNGQFWYEYESYSNERMSWSSRHYDIIKRAFNNPWAFEHLIYGVYRKDAYPFNFQFGRWRSIILLFFLLSIKGTIKTVNSVKIIKHTTTSDLKKYSKADYVKRNVLLKKILNRRIEERITIFIRLNKYIYISNEFSLMYKIKLSLFTLLELIRNKKEVCTPPIPFS